jgi:hypothetical protein
MAEKIDRRAVSAARTTPLAPEARRISGEQLKAGATDTALNAAGILRDVWEDFKSSDRFFKYKALVLVLWLGLSVTSVGVACPSSGGASNAIGARLVIAGDAKSPVYMVKNDGSEAWQDVEVLVNGKYRSTAAQVDPNREMTISPVVLFDESGNRAPSNLQIVEISVQVGTEEKVGLLQGGAPR